MTSLIGANAVVQTASDKVRFLKADRNGFPLNRQVPVTYQNYTGNGGQLVWDGSNEININAGLLTSNLTVFISQSLESLRSMIGRVVFINIEGSTIRSITISSVGTIMRISGTNTTTSNYVINPQNICRSIRVSVKGTGTLILDEGGTISSHYTFLNTGSGAPVYNYTAATNVAFRSLLRTRFLDTILNVDDITLSNTMPTFNKLTILYPYMTKTYFSSLQPIYIPDGSVYTVLIDQLEPIEEGSVVLDTGSIVGPGYPKIAIDHQPAPRRKEPTEIRLNIVDTDAGDYVGMGMCILAPILTNVKDKEYVCGSYGNGTLGMYDPYNNAGSSFTMRDANGIQVVLANNLNTVTVDIQDNLFFYTLTSSNTTIRWYCPSTGSSGVLLNVSSLLGTIWVAGGIIADICYCEEESILYVLPEVGNDRILYIPILPYEPLDSGNVRMGTIHSRTATLGATTTMYSICIDEITRMKYIAAKPLASNATIYSLVDNGSSLTGQNTFVTTIATTQRISLMYGSRGRLFVLYELNNRLHYLAYGASLNFGLQIAYDLPAPFMKSLTRNLYGCTQG